MYWENYGIYAVGSFDGIGFNQNAQYSFTIYRKNYKGFIVKQCVCAGNPATLRYLSDDPFGVRGSELVLTLVNIDNDLPLSYFYSEEDDTYKIEFNITYEESNVQVTKTLFTGFLIQEDSNENLTDIAHEIQLSFTDNLGSLKDIDFLTASRYSATSAANLRTSSANMVLSSEIGNTSGYIGLFNNTTFGNAVVGDFIFLNDSPVGDVSFEIIKIETVSGVKRYYVPGSFIGFGLTSNVKFGIVTGSSVWGKIKLKDALRICLHATGFNLDVKYAGNLTALSELQQTDTNFWNSVYIDGRSFMQDQNNWLSCYDVLDRICRRFNIACVQQDGSWYLVRLHENVIYSNVIPGINYNGYFEIQSQGNITNQISFGNGSDIEEGINETLLRPYQYYKETFKYKTTDNLLYNGDLQLLGPKIIQYNTTIDGVAVTVKEYEPVGFTLNSTFIGLYEITIRIIINTATGDEIDRYLRVVEVGQQSTTREVALSDLIEVNTFDKLKISFSYRTSTSNTNVTNSFLFNLSNSNTPANDYAIINVADTVLDEKFYKYWPKSAIAFPIDYFRDVLSTSDDSNTWRDVSFTTVGLIQSVLQIGLGQWDRTVSTIGETWYKNLQVEVLPSAGGKSVIDGHEHKSSINKILKNSKTQEVFIDDTTKNSIAGTFIFGTGTTARVRNKVIFWMDSLTVARYKLGEYTTREMMNWKLKPRTKLEGKILGIIRSDDSRFKIYNGLLFLINSGTFYIFGKAEFNFRDDTITCTLYELYKSGEYVSGTVYKDSVLYNFKYTYK